MKVLRQQKVSPPKQTIIVIPKTGGFLPLIPLFAAISSLNGEAASVAKAVNDVKTAAKTLEETKR